MKAKKRTTTAIQSVSPDDFKSHKIDSITSSFTPGGGNRTKRISIKGVPGSTFNLMLQDENFGVYSFTSGGFGGTPSPLSGIIPSTGVFYAVVNTGRAQSVDIRLTSQNPEATTSLLTQSIAGSKITITIDDTSLSNLTLTGASVTSSLINVGNSGDIEFACSVIANTGKLVNYVRAPKFSYSDSLPGSFVLYDGVAHSTNSDAYYANNDGVRLLSDIKIIEADGDDETKFDVIFNEVLALDGEATIPSDQAAYSTFCANGVIIKGIVRVDSMGAKDITINLMLYNFLEVITEA